MFTNPMEGPCFGFDYGTDEPDEFDRDDAEFHRRQDEELISHDGE